MKVTMKGFRFMKELHDRKSLAALEYALNLEDKKLTELMVAAGWVIPFVDEIDMDDPKQVARARLRGIHIKPF